MDRLAFVYTGAPLLGVAFGALAGALGFGWWAAICLMLGLIVSRSGWLWKGGVVLFAIFVFGRSSFLSVEEFDEIRTSRSVSGELIVGKLMTNWSGERAGQFYEEGKELRRVAVQDAELLEAGDRLEIEGKIFRPGIARNPDEFSMVQVWKRHGVESGLDLSNHQKIGFSWRNGVWRHAEQARAFIKKSTSLGIEDDSDAVSVIHAMTLGETPSSTSDITKAFRFSGAMHVFAVSGLHVTIIGGIVWGVLMVFGVQRRQAILSILLVMFGYALVTGGNPPAIRASLMAAAVLSAFLLKRRPSLFNSLSLSLILVLFWSPAQVYEIGFQLSYAVISAIALGYQSAYEWTGKIAQLDPFFPRRLLSGGKKFFLNIRGKVAAILATSLAAWLGSLPWMIHHFGLITPVSVLASLLLIPLTFLVLALSFLSSFLALFSTTASSGVNQVNSVVAYSAFLSAKGFSKVPLGHYVIGDRVPADWVVFDLADGGSSSFLASGDGLLIDCGSERNYRHVVRSGLRRWSSDPRCIIYTHPDGKHSGALNSFEKDFSPKRTILPLVWSRSPSYREFVGKEDFGIRGIEVAEDEERFIISDDVSLEIVRKGVEGLDALSDSRGIAFKVHWQNWKVLVMGDLGVVEERELLEQNVDISADVVLIGQHGRTYSGSIEFLQATGAKVVIKSAATFPSKELPKKRWLEACKEFKIEVFNQRDTGAVLIDFEEDRLCVKSHLEEDRLFILVRD